MRSFSTKLLCGLGFLFVACGLMPLFIRNWRPHILNLLSRVLDTILRASSSSTFNVAYWGIGLAAAIWVVNFLRRAIKLKNDGTAYWLSQSLRENYDQGIAGTVVIFVFWMMAFLYFGIGVIYEDHEALLRVIRDDNHNNASMARKVAEISTEIDWRKHNVSTSDPVFPNLIYMLQAFATLKKEMNNQPCVLYFTATEDSEPFASTMAQLAGPMSGCAGFGPSTTDQDLDAEAFRGMKSGFITIHALEGEKAADGLFSTLGNQTRLRRSYKMFDHPEKRFPQRGGEHVIWLQFGPKAKWNSELP